MTVRAEPAFQTSYPLAYEADVDTRADFIRKTYLHLAGAVLAFIGLEAVFFAVLPADAITSAMLSSPWAWLAVLGGFMFVSFVSERMALSSTSVPTQYAGLSLYVVGEAVIFIPILFIAANFFEGVILQAAIISLAVFAGLTVFALTTTADFSFLRGFLMIGGCAAMGFIVAALFMPSLGGTMFSLVFSGAMILLASGYILYQTSQIMHHYPIGTHVAASLGLFASLALLFWYVLRIVMIFASDD